MQLGSGTRELSLFHIDEKTKMARKSAPRISRCTSAMMKTQGKGRWRPRLRLRDRLPEVRIGVSFTAMRVSLSGGCRQSVGVGGMTDLGTCVDEKTCVRVIITYVEKAT